MLWSTDKTELSRLPEFTAQELSSVFSLAHTTLLLLLLFSLQVALDSFVSPWTVACQAPLPRQEYWSVLPFSSPEDLPDPRIEPRPPALQLDSLPLSHQGSSAGDWVGSKRVSRPGVGSLKGYHLAARRSHIHVEWLGICVGQHITKI